MAVATPAAPAPVAVRRSSGGSRYKAQIEKLQAGKAAALKKARELSSSKPARVGFAGVGGALGGLVNQYTSIAIGERSIPWALPLGLAGAIFGGKSPEVEAVSLGMLGFGVGTALGAEAARMGYGRAS
jgi:hypothetical protein